jgi:histidinol-phosphate aminotransferase
VSRPYQPPAFTSPIDLDLSRNEGPARVTEVTFSSAELASLTARYPDTTGLRQLLASRHHLTTEQVLVTAGGDDALFRCFLAISGGSVVTTTPTFEMIRRYSEQVGATLVEVPWWDGAFPIGDFLEDTSANPGMAVIVSPNNPTGSVITESDLRKVAGAFPLLVLDAAYMDFADEDLTNLALELENVVVIRTLSKALGLAGLRVGYLLGPPGLVTAIGGYGSPYSVSALSAALASQVLDSGADGETTSAVVAERDALIALLSELGCDPLPSQANFVLATGVDPLWLVSAAASLGIGLRRFPDLPELRSSVRVSLPADRGGFRRLEATLRTALAPEAILFDLDGVLVDVSRSYRTAIIETAAVFGVGVEVGDIAAAKAMANASDDWQLTRALCAAVGVDVALGTVRQQFERLYQGEGEVPGLKSRERLLVDREVLHRLSERLPLGVVTSRPRKDADEVLRRFEIAACFGTVVTREDAPSKPDPAPVRLAMERLGVRHAWMVGDTPDDLLAAQAAGALPIGVIVPGYDPLALSGAARVLTSAEQIEELLDVTSR